MYAFILSSSLCVCVFVRLIRTLDDRKIGMKRMLDCWIPPSPPLKKDRIRDMHLEPHQHFPTLHCFLSLSLDDDDDYPTRFLCCPIETLSSR